MFKALLICVVLISTIFATGKYSVVTIYLKWDEINIH